MRANISRRRFIEIAAAGTAALALPLPRLVAGGGGRRVLVVGESILNAPLLPAAMQAVAPGTATELWTYSGSMSTMGLFILAGHVYRASQPANLLDVADVTQWGQNLNVQMSPARSPSTGKTVTLLQANGPLQPHVNGIHGHGSMLVPASPRPLQFGLTVEPGTLFSFGIRLNNPTREGPVASAYFTSRDLAASSNLPTHYLLQVTPESGVGYGPGDLLVPYIYPGSPEGVDGSLYVSEAELFWGQDPGVTASPGEISSLTATTHAPLFDTVVIQFGRNDAGAFAAGPGPGSALAPDPDQHAQILGGIIESAQAFAGRVLVCTPPPLADSRLRTYSSNDPFVDLGYLAAQQSTAASLGCQFFDAVNAFRAAAATTPVSALMRDTIHPSTSTPDAAGLSIYARAIAAALAQPVGDPHGTAPATAYLAAASAEGDWQTRAFAGVTQPARDPFGLHVGVEKAPRLSALTSTEPGATLHYPVQGSLFGIVVLADQTVGGTAEIALDGQSVTNIDLLRPGIGMYPLGLFIPGDGTRRPRDLTVTVGSGEVRVAGVVALHD